MGTATILGTYQKNPTRLIGIIKLSVNKHDGEDYVNPHRRFYFAFSLKILLIANIFKH